MKAIRSAILGVTLSIGIAISAFACWPADCSTHQLGHGCNWPGECFTGSLNK